MTKHLNEYYIGTHTSTQELVKKYADHGFLVHPNALPNDLQKQLATAVDAATTAALAEADNGTTYLLDGKRFIDTDLATIQFEHYEGAATPRVIEPIHVFNSVLNKLVDHPLISNVMHALVGTKELSLWTAKLNLKKAQEGSGFGWHQDSPYWVHDSNHVDQLPNVMITLDDQTIENGCFEIIALSHLRGVLPGTNDGSQLGGFFTDPKQYDVEDRIPMLVPAGSLIYFSPHCIHGSAPNRSDSDRRALIYTYQPAGHKLLKLDEERRVKPINYA